MADVLIRDVPDDVLSAIDARASRLGLSRTEYLRRKLAHDAVIGSRHVTADDLRSFGQTFGDLADDEVMSAAWE